MMRGMSAGAGRGRRIALAALAAALAGAAGAVWALRGGVEEQVLLWRRESRDPKLWVESAERLAEMGSVRALERFLASARDKQSAAQAELPLGLAERCAARAGWRAIPALSAFLRGEPQQLWGVYRVAVALTAIDPRSPAGLDALGRLLRTETAYIELPAPEQ